VKTSRKLKAKGGDVLRGDGREFKAVAEDRK